MFLLFAEPAYHEESGHKGSFHFPGLSAYGHFESAGRCATEAVQNPVAQESLYPHAKTCPQMPWVSFYFVFFLGGRGGKGWRSGVGWGGGGGQ